jgi:hypothetical protein
MQIRLFLAAAFVALGTPAFGGVLTLNLDPSSAASAAGGSVIFAGTISASVDDFCCLNDLTVDFVPPAATYLSLDPNFFFENVPGVLFAFNGNTYSGPIFEILVAANAPWDKYMGTVNILGGDFFASDILASEDIQVEVTPESGLVGYMLSGLAALMLVRRHRLQAVKW